MLCQLSEIMNVLAFWTVTGLFVLHNVNRYNLTLQEKEKYKQTKLNSIYNESTQLKKFSSSNSVI